MPNVGPTGVNYSSPRKRSYFDPYYEGIQHGRGQINWGPTGPPPPMIPTPPPTVPRQPNLGNTFPFLGISGPLPNMPGYGSQRADIQAQYGLNTAQVNAALEQVQAALGLGKARLATDEGRAIQGVQADFMNRGVGWSSGRTGTETQTHGQYARQRQDLTTQAAQRISDLNFQLQQAGLNRQVGLDQLGIQNAQYQSSTPTNMQGAFAGLDPSLRQYIGKYGGLATYQDTTLQQQALNSLRALQGAGFNIFPHIGQDYRTFVDQQRIYNSGVRPAARPGHSLHELGLAIDVSGLPSWVRNWLYANNWHQFSPSTDAGHWSYGLTG